MKMEMKKMKMLISVLHMVCQIEMPAHFMVF